MMHYLKFYRILIIMFNNIHAPKSSFFGNGFT